MALKCAVIRSTDRNTWRTKEKETGRVSSTERTKKETNKDTTRFIARRKSPKKSLSLAKESVIGPLEFSRREGRSWCNVKRKKTMRWKRRRQFLYVHRICQPRSEHSKVGAVAATTAGGRSRAAAGVFAGSAVRERMCVTLSRPPLLYISRMRETRIKGKRGSKRKRREETANVQWMKINREEKRRKRKKRTGNVGIMLASCGKKTETSNLKGIWKGRLSHTWKTDLSSRAYQPCANERTWNYNRV